MAVPNMVDLINLIKQMEIRLNRNVTNKIEFLSKSLKALSTSYVLSNPFASFEIREQKLDTLINRLNSNITYRLDSVTTRFNNLKASRILNKPEEMFIRFNNTLELNINKLELLNPLSVLSKGYSVASVDDKIIKSVKEVKKNDKLNIKLLDGIVETTVEGVK